MAHRKIPQDAFTFYVSLGTSRSYQKVAEKYGVTKRAVVNLGAREKWQAQVAELERKARERANDKTSESMDAMNERHLKSARIVQGKALEALRGTPLETAMAAVKALDTGIRQERLIRGEPSDRTAVSVEETIRSEYERWMTVSGGDGAEEAEEGQVGAEE